MIRSHASKFCLLDVSARLLENKSYKEGSCGSTIAIAYIRRRLTGPLRAALHPIASSNTRAITDNNDPNNDPNNEPIRCPCGSKDDLPQSQKGKDVDPWISCETCLAWQHKICVGLEKDESRMTDKYHWEECKPEHHKRFRFDLEPDDCSRIAKQRQEMAAMPRPRQKDETKKKMTWLVAEIDAIMQGHPQAVTVEWARINGVKADFHAAKETRHASVPTDSWTMADFEFMVRNAIGIVLWNAPISAAESFGTRITKVRFAEAEAVVTELWILRAWLNVEFMNKIEAEGSRLGRSDFESVRRYFK